MKPRLILIIVLCETPKETSIYLPLNLRKGWRVVYICTENSLVCKNKYKILQFSVNIMYGELVTWGTSQPCERIRVCKIIRIEIER